MTLALYVNILASKTKPSVQFIKKKFNKIKDKAFRDATHLKNTSVQTAKNKEHPIK